MFLHDQLLKFKKNYEYIKLVFKFMNFKEEIVMESVTKN